MLLDVEVVDIDPVESSAGEDCGGIGCPHGVDDDHAHIEEHDLSLRVGRVPDSDGPVSRSRDEGCGMVVVPSDLIDSEQVALVSLLVLPRVSKRAFVDLALFGTNQKREVVELVEVEAQTTCESDERSFFLLLTSELQFEDFFRFELILHQTPVHDPTI